MEVVLVFWRFILVNKQYGD